MIWLTWRQFRTQAMLVYAALAALAVVLAVTGVQLADLSRVSGNDFFNLFAADRRDTAVFYIGVAAVISMPAIVGVFWGAPLVARELEAGTHRLVWNQTVTRTSWLATKVGLIGLAAVVGAGLLSLIVTWWCGPLDDAIANGAADRGLFGVPRVSPELFGARGVAPMGYTAFAFALGVTAGLVIRRTVPAMAVTLAVFVAVQIAMPTWVRPHFGPSQLTTTITAANLRGLQIERSVPAGRTGPVGNIDVAIDQPGAWVIANETVDATGQVVGTLPTWVAGCVPAKEPVRGDPGCFDKLAQAGYRQRVTYQPAGRYWTLQAYETAIFVALALLLIGSSFWWLRHRLS